MPDNDKTETITFELIRRIQREEQVMPKLTKLPENFYEKARKYLEQKKKILASKTSKINTLEAKNIERLLEDVFNRRERKVCNQAIITARTSIPPENLTSEEKLFFDQILQTIKSNRASNLESMLTAEPAEETVKETPEIILIKAKFKEDIPEFIGSDMQTYGPFKAEDIAEIPQENFKILAGKVDKLENENI